MSLGFQDNLDNAIGADTANNLFSSTNVVANEDGTVIERREYAQGLLDGTTTIPAAVKREAGRRQVLTVTITGAANAGSITLGTITTQACTIEKVILTADSGFARYRSNSSCIKGYNCFLCKC